MNNLASELDNLERTKRLLKRKEQECQELDDELYDTQNKLSQAKKNLQKSQSDYEVLSNQHSKLEDSYHSLEKVYQNLKTDFQQEKETTKLRENLVGALLSTKNENVHLTAFKHILQNDFLAFASEESSLQNEAGALLKLQEIERELTMISGFPAFHSAHTIAVGGGFSAGKSEFISSFFKDKSLKLPSSIEPTTAIATYVVNKESNEDNIKQNQKKKSNKTTYAKYKKGVVRPPKVKSNTNNLTGINVNGAAVDLLKIDPELVQKLNHQFMRSFNFPLKSIMPYMFLSTGLKYEHICFVDTPGYNPTGSHTSEDMAVAQEFVSNSDALIWLVGADANGTIPRTDILFLKNILRNNTKPVYFVLNKADLKPKSDIVKILKEFNQVLEREKIPYAGISAYSSIDAKEMDYVKNRLCDFLLEMNTLSNKQDNILRKLYEVERSYQFAIKKDIKQRKALTKALDDISFDLNKKNFEKGKGSIYDRLETIASYFNTSNEERNLNTLETLITNFTYIINQIFGQISDVERPNVNDDGISIEEFKLEEYKKEKNTAAQENFFVVNFEFPLGTSTEQINATVDRFMEEAIGKNGLSYEGSGYLAWEGLVCLDKLGRCNENHRKLVKRWLENNRLLNVQVGKLLDINWD